MTGDYYRPLRKNDNYHYRLNDRRLTIADVASSPNALQPKTTKFSPKQHYQHHSPLANIPIVLKATVAKSKSDKQCVPGDQAIETQAYTTASSPSRSSSYSLPSPPVPNLPKALLCETPRSEETNKSVRWNLSTDLSIAHCSSLDSPIVAPWNSHQTEMAVPGNVRKSKHETLHGRENDNRPYKRARETPSMGSPLPEAVDRCDNFGCNGFHSHFDCPLERKCWGCRSRNHFTSDCPMTCTNCGFEGHIKQNCDDFEMDPHEGIVRPQRPSFKPGSSANTLLPPLSGDKVYQCDNYPCRDLHSHWDCPLPTSCWGCRSSEHFWSGCHERCGKCGAQRHTTKYCEEFELWGQGMSRPKRRPEDIVTYAMKRKRESEIQENGTHNLQAMYPTPTSRHTSTPPEPSYAEGSTPSSGYDHGKLVSARPSPKESTVTTTDRVTKTSQTPTKSFTAPVTSEDLPPRTHEENGRKIYCTYWLRTGRCLYALSRLGCALKHRVPADEETQREIGINVSSPWLRDDPVVKEIERQTRRSAGRLDRTFEKLAAPSTSPPAGSRPSSGEARRYPEPPPGFLWSPNKRLRELDRKPEPAGKHADTSSPSSYEVGAAAYPVKKSISRSSQSKLAPAKQNEPVSQSVRDFFQSMGSPPKSPEPATSSPSKLKPARASAELRSSKTATLRDPIVYQIDKVKTEDVSTGQNTPKEQKLTPKEQDAIPVAPAPNEVDDAMSARMKAFEEEEYFKQKRHEAEMARKAEEHRLEYEHELRMMELRKQKS